jgi:hypothetical protein
MSIQGIVSNVKARIATGRPYIIGGVIGAVAISVVAFNAGWVVAIGTHTNAVQQGQLEAVATVCAAQANQYWLAEGNKTASLEGWSNDARDQLAERFTPRLEEIAGLKTSEITRLCGRMLKSA